MLKNGGRLLLQIGFLGLGGGRDGHFGKNRRLWPALVLILFLSLLHPARAGLPPDWTEVSIGTATGSGAASDDNGEWTVSSAGTNIGGASDQFNFACQIQTGDFDMAVCVGPWDCRTFGHKLV